MSAPTDVADVSMKSPSNPIAQVSHTLSHFDKSVPSPPSESRPEARHEKQVNLQEDPLHLLRNQAPEAIRLDEAETNRDWRNVLGRKSGVCIFRESIWRLRVSSSNAASDSARCRLRCPPCGLRGRTGFAAISAASAFTMKSLADEVFVVVELADASVEEVATRAEYAEGATLRTLLSWETRSGAAIARCRSAPLQKAESTKGRGSDVEH